MLSSVFLVALALLRGAVGPPPPPGSAEGDFVEVDGQVYEVHGGKLYTLDDPALDDPRLTVTVTGTNMGRARQKKVVRPDVVTSEAIAASGAHTLGDVLAQQAGIQVNPSFGLGQDVSIDGLDSRQVLVLVDGRPVKGRVDSHVDVSRLPVDAATIERIEIVRGPSSALYGSEAIGGVINVVTKKPSAALGGEVDAGTQLMAGAAWGTLGLHGHGGAGPVAARVDVTGSNLPGFDRAGVVDGAPTAAGVPTQNVVLRPDGHLDLPDRRQASLHAEAATALFDDVDFRAVVDGSASESLSRSAFGAASAGASGAPGAFAERARDSELSAAATVEAGVFAGGELAVDVRVDRFNHLFDKLPNGDARFSPSFCDGPVDPACPAAPVLNTDATEDESRVEAKLALPSLLEPASIVGGVDASVGAVVTREQDRRKNGKGEDTLPGGSERDVASAYGELLWTPLPWLFVIPGGRVDAFTPAAKASNAALSPKLAARADLPLGFAVRASYGHGFRLPSYEERLLLFDHSELGYIVEGNPALLPEESNGFRGGVSYEPSPQVSLATEAYLNLVDGLIDFADGGAPQDGVPVFTYVNKKHAYTSGIDVRVALGPWFGFSLDGAYQYLINAVDADGCPADDPYFCTDGARSLLLRPAHTANATLKWRTDATKTSLFARVNATSERITDTSGLTVPGYATVAVGVKQPLGNFEVSVLADNLLDAYDPRLGPKPGRSVTLQLRVWQ